MNLWRKWQTKAGVELCDMSDKMNDLDAIRHPGYEEVFLCGNCFALASREFGV